MFHGSISKLPIKTNNYADFYKTFITRKYARFGITVYYNEDNIYWLFSILELNVISKKSLTFTISNIIMRSMSCTILSAPLYRIAQ